MKEKIKIEIKNTRILLRIDEVGWHMLDYIHNLVKFQIELISIAIHSLSLSLSPCIYKHCIKNNRAIIRCYVLHGWIKFQEGTMAITTQDQVINGLRCDPCVFVFITGNAIPLCSFMLNISTYRHFIVRLVLHKVDSKDIMHVSMC